MIMYRKTAFFPSFHNLYSRKIFKQRLYKIIGFGWASDILYSPNVFSAQDLGRVWYWAKMFQSFQNCGHFKYEKDGVS